MNHQTRSPFLSSPNTNTSHQGSLWAVLLQPSFPDLVFEASALLTKSTLPSTLVPNLSPILLNHSKSSGFLPSDFSIQIKQKALDLIQHQIQHQIQDDQEEDLKEIHHLDTNEIKDEKIKIVEEIWTQLQVGCFNKSDDRELEATINLLMTLLLLLFSTDQFKFASMVQQLLEVISKADGKTTPYGRYNVLFTLFNGLPEPIQNQIPLQFEVLNKLTEMSFNHPEEINLILPTLLKVPKYLTLWNLMKSNEGIQLIQNILDLLKSTSKSLDAYHLSITYLSSIEFHHSLDDQTLQIKLDHIIDHSIQLTLMLNDCYRWDLLDDIKPISSYIQSNPIGKTRYEKLFQLLQSNHHHQEIEDLLNSNLTQLSNPIKESIKFKSKLLTLTDLCSKRVGGNVTYSEIKSLLGLKSEGDEEEGMEVEEWIINAVKAKLISARVDQPNQLVYINQSSSRSFGNHDWKVLGTKLTQWSDSIDNLIEVLDQSLNDVKLISVTA